MTTFALPLLKKMGHGDDCLSAPRGQLGQWVTRHGALSIPDPAPEALSYWFELAVHVPLLSKVAVAIFSITPSEACVERSFSAQGLVHSDLRSNLEDSSVQAIMQVRMNIHHLYVLPDQSPAKKPRSE